MSGHAECGTSLGGAIGQRLTGSIRPATAGLMFRANRGGRKRGSLGRLRLLPGVDAVAVAAGGGAQLELGVQASGPRPLYQQEQLLPQGGRLVSWNGSRSVVRRCRGDQLGGDTGPLR